MIEITQEKETMLIPLYGKALDYSGNPSVLNDVKASEIIKNISYGFTSLKIPKKTNVMMRLRAKIESLPSGSERVVVIAEGLMMYLEEDEIKLLMKRLENHFGSYTIIFDAYSCLTAKHAGNHPSLKRTGATIRWGVDDPTSLSAWSDNIGLIGEYYFSDIGAIKLLGKGTQLMYSFAGLFLAARRAHRVLVYKME